MANTSTNSSKAALLQGIPPAPNAVEGGAPKPAKEVITEKEPAVPKQAANNQAMSAPASPAGSTKKTDKADKDLNFGEAGAFNINDQWSTSIRYEGKSVDGQVSELNVKFANGRKQVAAVNLVSREAAVEILGERNVANIEAGLGKDKEVLQTGSLKGKLQAEDLAFKKSYTLDRKPENQIERDTGREAQNDTDAEVRRWVEARREQLRQQRLLNEKAVGGKDAAGTDTSQAAPGRGSAASEKTRPGRDGQTEQKPNPGKDASAADQKENRDKAIPRDVAARFVQDGDKYFFPDKSFAFQDRGSKLATNNENQEVVRSLVAIARERGWDSITARGAEEFRRGVWLEGSTQGLHVTGYKPTAVEKAHLASILEKQGERDMPNTVSKGRDRDLDQAKSMGQAPNQAQAPTKESTDAAPASPQAAKTASVNTRPGATVGKLVEHGEANYQNDPKKDKSYFVTVETVRGPKTVWGVDLERAVNKSGVQVGETISVEHQGKEKVKAKERVYDQAGKVTGERDVETHRNQWLVGSVDKAQAFAAGERAEVVGKHPDLAPAYGAIAAAKKVAEKAWPGNKDEQARFVAATVQVLADKIAAGEKVPAPKIRETRTREQSPQEKTKETGKELERER